MVRISEAFEAVWERERESREIEELERLAALLVMLFGTHPPT
jgi:hypothetical protein